MTLAAVTRGEIRYGLERLPAGKRRSALERAVNLLLAALGPDLPVDTEASEHFGAAKARLERTGRPIPDNDLWLAAVAVRHTATVVTADGHFAAVSGLNRVNWLLPR